MSVVIIFSIILVLFKDKINLRINFFRMSILAIIGVIHGLTNSGGTLMSLALSSNNKKESARYNITFFYLALASFQYLATYLMFKSSYFILQNVQIVLVIFLGVLIGNVLNKFLSENNYKFIVFFLAFISSIFLLINT